MESDEGDQLLSTLSTQNFIKNNTEVDGQLNPPEERSDLPKNPAGRKPTKLRKRLPKPKGKQPSKPIYKHQGLAAKAAPKKQGWFIVFFFHTTSTSIPHFFFFLGTKRPQVQVEGQKMSTRRSTKASEANKDSDEPPAWFFNFMKSMQQTSQAPQTKPIDDETPPWIHKFTGPKPQLTPTPLTVVKQEAETPSWVEKFKNSGSNTPGPSSSGSSTMTYDDFASQHKASNVQKFVEHESEYPVIPKPPATFSEVKEWLTRFEIAIDEVEPKLSWCARIINNEPESTNKREARAALNRLRRIFPTAGTSRKY